MSTPGTLNFPVSLDDVTSLFDVANNSQSTLSGEVGVGDTTIAVASTATFPSSGSIVIDNEIIYYTGTSGGTTFTGCVRGQAGSSAAVHTTTTSVLGRIIASHHNILASAIIATQTKIGIGSDTPVSGDFFKGTGTGTSGWSALSSGEVTTALGFTPVTNARNVNSGAGLSGGGALSGDLTLLVDLSTFDNNIVLWNAANASRTLTANLSGGTDPVITFSDALINISTGAFQVGGVAVPTISSTSTLTNKTLTAPVITNAVQGGNTKALTDNTNVGLFEVALPTLTAASGEVSFTIIAADATDIQVRSGIVRWSCINKAADYTTELAIVNEGGSASAGTLDATFDILEGSDKITLRVNADTSLTTTSFTIRYTVINNSTQAITIL